MRFPAFDALRGGIRTFKIRTTLLRRCTNSALLKYQSEALIPKWLAANKAIFVVNNVKNISKKKLV